MRSFFLFAIITAVAMKFSFVPSLSTTSIAKGWEAFFLASSSNYFIFNTTKDVAIASRNDSGQVETYPLEIKKKETFLISHSDTECESSVANFRIETSSDENLRLVSVETFASILTFGEWDSPEDLVFGFGSDEIYHHVVANWDWVNSLPERKVIALVDLRNFPICDDRIYETKPVNSGVLLPFEANHTLTNDNDRTVRLRGKMLSWKELDINMSVQISGNELDSCATAAYSKILTRRNDWMSFLNPRTNSLKTWFFKIKDVLKGLLGNTDNNIMKNSLRNGILIPFNIDMSGEILSDRQEDPKIGGYAIQSTCRKCKAYGRMRFYIDVQGLNPLRHIAQEKNYKPTFAMNVTIEEMYLETIFRAAGYGKVPQSLVYEKPFRSWYIPDVDFNLLGLLHVRPTFNLNIGTMIQGWSAPSSTHNGAVLQAGSRMYIPPGTHAGFVAEQGELRMADVSPDENWRGRVQQLATYASDPSARANVNVHVNIALGFELEILGVHSQEAGIQFQMPVYRAIFSDPSNSDACKGIFAVGENSTINATMPIEKTKKVVAVSSSIEGQIVAYYGRNRLANTSDSWKDSVILDSNAVGTAFESSPFRNNNNVPAVAETPSRLNHSIPIYQFGTVVSENCVPAGFHTLEDGSLGLDKEVIVLAGGGETFSTRSPGPFNQQQSIGN